VSKSNYSMLLKSNTQIGGEVINQPTHETMIIKRERERDGNYKNMAHVVSFWFLSKQQNPGNNVSRKTELVSIRVNVTLV
jgi:hypothetical protein